MSKMTLEYMTIAEVETPKEGHVVYLNRWWITSPDGTSITFARFPASRLRSPQCNHDRRIVVDLQRTMYPDHGVTLVPLAYLPRQDES